MDITLAVDETYQIPADRFSQEAVAHRVGSLEPAAAVDLGRVLRYLYLDEGPTNLTLERIRSAEAYLDPAEQILARWLQIRTNGKLRSQYGAPSHKAARKARYRCEKCGYPDVRALNLDHVSGRVKGTAFACLCANCHSIKSRVSGDWSGARRTPSSNGEPIP